MANEYAVNASDLKAVADAIRAKGGTSDALSFPAGFVSAVGAIQAGGGSSGGSIAGSDTPDGNLMSNMLYAITSGNAVRGEFTLATPLPNTETLIFDSGLDTLNGFLIYNADHDGTMETSAEHGLISAALINHDAGVKEWTKAEATPTLFKAQIAYTYTAKITGNPYDPSQSGKGPIFRVSSIRIDAGRLYCTAEYNKHASYSPFKEGMRYVWFAW